MVDLLNADRTAAGLVPVRVDARLMAIARARSVDMATKHYFSHTQPDGRNVFDILTAKQASPGTAPARSSPGTTTRPRALDGQRATRSG